MICEYKLCFLITLLLPLSMCNEQPSGNETAAGEVTIGSPCPKVIDKQQQQVGATVFHYSCPDGYICDYQTDRCKCMQSSVPDSANKKCLPKAYNIGNPCTESVQCTSELGEKSECSKKEGKCECSEGTEWSNDHSGIIFGMIGKCLPVGHVPIGGLCNETSDCVGPAQASVCFAGICSCDFVNETYGVGGFVVSRDMRRCLRVRSNFGEECEESQQCHHGPLGHLSECKEEFGSGSLRKVCKCGDDAVAQPRLNKCFPMKRKVGEECQVQMQCVAGLGPSECLNGKCVCIQGTFWNEAKTRCSLK